MLASSQRDYIGNEDRQKPIDSHRTQQHYLDHHLAASLRDFRKEILEFGDTNESSSSINNRVERENTLESFSHLFSEEHRLKASYNDMNKLRPGYSAKRYLSNWIKHWKPEMAER